MNLSKDKIHIVYYPFLFLSAACIFIYTFLNWLLIIKLHLFNLKEEIINLWIPFGLPWIPLWIWLRPRVKLLKFKQTARDPVMGYLFFAGFAMIAPCIIAQEYIETATGKITHLKNINEINSNPKTKYYSIDEYAVNKKQAASWLTREVSGKGSTRLDLTLYIICPIYPDSSYIQSKSRVLNDSPLLVRHKPLIIFDGLVIDSGQLLKISPANIASISVLKGNAAISLYGKAGSNGVIIIKGKHLKSVDSNIQNSKRPLPDSVLEEPTLIKPKKTSEDAKNWIGFKFFKSISNKSSADVKTTNIADFKNESWKQFHETAMNDFTYFDRISNNNNLQGYEKALHASPNTISSDSSIILEAKTTLFSARNGSKGQWIFGSFAIGAFVWLLFIFFTPLNEEKLNDFLNGVKKERDDKSFKEFFSFFIPREGFYVTPILMDINILVFVAMVISGLGFISFSAKDLIPWGANFGINTTDGEWWRLLTSTFVHGGVMHLLLNMYALIFVGLFLEPVINKKRFILFYLFTGLCASFASAEIHPYTVSVGASGAIFGMYGVFIALLTTKVFPPAMKKAFLISTLIFVVYNLLVGFTMSGIVDNAAHIGGLVSGFILGFMSYPSIKREQDEKVETEN